MIKDFSRELSKGGQSQLLGSVGEEFVRDWYITLRKWNEESQSWDDEGVKRKVKLHSLALKFSEPPSPLSNVLGYVSASEVKFDDLLNEPEECFSVSFSKYPLTKMQVGSVFDEGRLVRCHCCNLSRNRGKAYICESDGSNYILGASCFNRDVTQTPIKFIKWYGYYQPRFDTFTSTIAKETRMLKVVSYPDKSSKVSLSLYLSGLIDIVEQDSIFVTSKGPMPTSRRCLERILNGENFKLSNQVKPFKKWVYSLSNKNAFYKKAKATFFDAVKDGVDIKNAAVIAALMSQYMKEEDVFSGYKLKLGYCSGIAKVSAVTSEANTNIIDVVDGYGRLLSFKTSRREKIGAVVAFSGIVEKIDVSNVFPIHHLTSFQLHGL